MTQAMRDRSTAIVHFKAVRAVERAAKGFGYRPREWTARCTRKKGFRTLAEANAQATAKGIVVYECQYCPFWHIGHAN